MIDFGKFKFAGAPRAGTTWILKATYVVGLGEFSKSFVHVPHKIPQRGREVPQLKVSTVRNPCDWIISYYAAIRGQHVNVPAVDEFLKIPTITEPGEPKEDYQKHFQEFVEAYLAKMPGQIGKVFFSYNADSYIKVEDFPWSYIEMLISTGMKEDKARLCEQVARQNEGRNLPVLDRKLKQKVMDAEQKMVEAFEYY